MCHKVDPPIIQSQEGTEVKLGFRRVPLKNILQLLSMTLYYLMGGTKFSSKTFQNQPVKASSACYIHDAKDA